MPEHSLFWSSGMFTRPKSRERFFFFFLKNARSNQDKLNFRCDLSYGVNLALISVLFFFMVPFRLLIPWVLLRYIFSYRSLQWLFIASVPEKNSISLSNNLVGAAIAASIYKVQTAG